MFKNVATKIALFAFDTTTGAAKTGDAANLTAYVSKDYGSTTVLADTSATEQDSTNAKGWYLFDVAQGETNADALLFTCKSSTANIAVVGQYIFTTPNRFSTLVIDSAGLADANMVKAGPSGSGAAVPAGAVPNAVAGASGGLMISGSNSGTTTLGALTVTGATTLTGAVSGTNASNDLRINGAVPGAAGGLFIAGSNAALTVASITCTGTFSISGVSNVAQTGDSFARIGATGSGLTSIPGLVWDVTLSGHLASGTTGYALNAAGSAGDPWGTALPGAYGAGSAGYIVGTNLDALITSRLASGSYTAPLSAAGTRSALGLGSANLDSQLDALPTATENADAVLKRDWTAVTGEASRSLLNAARWIRNGFTITGGSTANILKEDDVSVAYTRTLTTDPAAEPITGVS